MTDTKPDRPALGLLLMLGFCVLAPLGDGLAKLATATTAVGLLLWIRFGIQAVILTVLGTALRLTWGLSRRVLTLIILRTVLHVAGSAMMYAALIFLPLADAIAIAFVMPFIQLLLGKLVLGEEAGTRRLAACAVGFLGTLMVTQPAFAEVGWPALLPLGVALTFSLFMLITRQLAKLTDPIGLQAVSGGMAFVMLTPPVLLALQNFEMPSAGLDYGLVLAIGLMGTAAHLLMTWSLRFAPSTTVAPMQYLEIPFATLIGFLMFSDLPNLLASAGIALTIGAGLYILLRERAIARQTATPE